MGLPLSYGETLIDPRGERRAFPHALHVSMEAGSGAWHANDEDRRRRRAAAARRTLQERLVKSVDHETRREIVRTLRDVRPCRGVRRCHQGTVLQAIAGFKS